MKYIEYPLYQEGFINRFITTGVCTKVQSFNKVTLSGRVNEWLKKGFSIHENPCRKEFIDVRKSELPTYMDLSKYGLGDEISVFDELHKLKLYTPFGNIAQEESGFYYVPTYLRTYSYAIIKSEKEETVEFELSTCGGLTLWVNDELVEDFIPFTRNMIKSTKVLVHLKKGDNKFVVCLDDLAERDTDYYFRIKRLGDAKLSILIPVKKDISADKILIMEEILDNLYLDKESYISETLTLHINNSTSTPIKFDLIITPAEFIEKMENNHVLIKKRSYLLDANHSTIDLLHTDELHPCFYYLTIEIEIDGVLLKRKIGTNIVREEFLNYQEENIDKRKKHGLDIVKQFGVDNVYKAAALFKLGEDYKLAEAIILEELEGVRKRKDCCDFHLVIILYIYRTFYEVLSDELIGQIEEALLGFRYWIDEPGDDVMWFFSENHALLFHICQYFAGMYLPEQVFHNSNKLGKEIHARATELLNEWFDNFFLEFITEWNSNAYIPVDVLGIGTLYNLAADDDVFKEKAKKALDMIFYALSINEHKGAVMTSFGRSYEKELKGNQNAGTTGLLHMAYNTGYINRSIIGYIALILGDYEAPVEYKKYMNLKNNQVIIHENTQGFEQHVNLYLYKNADVALSTAIGFKPYKPGYQEHIVQATIDATAQVFVNHPGESHPYGSGRPNFWAGNGVLPMAVQYRNISILKYNIHESNRIDYTHAYIPTMEFTSFIHKDNIIVLEKDGGLIGVYAYNGLIVQEKGPCRQREFISTGRENLWIIKVERACNYKNLEDFYNNFKSMVVFFNEEKEVHIIDKVGTTYFINKEDTFYVNGEEIYQYPLTVEGRLELEDSSHD